MKRALYTVVAVFLHFTSSTIISKDKTPTVDLDYAVHQGQLNTSYNYYSFRNIRYAEPPVGELRWKPPVPPQSKNRTVNDGRDSPICPQSYPGWGLIPVAEAEGISAEELSEMLMSDPRMNEDCLFLDVHVPENVFRNKNSKKKGVAVMAWIHGGGYDLGYKHDEQFDPAGLITRSQINNQEGIIFVSLNYRLGMFGFLPGVGDSITRNVGFLDQRLALDWIQKRIRAFGGDPHRVTIIGSSAGAGSVMHQITAFGGEGKVPFSSAIAQSPSVRATINDTEVWEKTIQAASTVLGEEIETAEQLRQLNSSVLMNVNQAVVFNGSYGLFTYGPTVDGTFVPDIPSVLLLNGRFHDDVKVMVGHNKNESGDFIPYLTTNDELVSLLRNSYPVSESAEETILTKLYPDELNGSHGYTSQHDRAKLLVDELVYTCNTRFLGTAFQNQTYNYRFEYPPGMHGQELPWTFFVEEDETVEPGLARVMQRYFTNFAMTGNPNGKGGICDLPDWPVYGDEAKLATFGTDGVGIGPDKTVNERCEYWQKGEYRRLV